MCADARWRQPPGQSVMLRFLVEQVVRTAEAVQNAGAGSAEPQSGLPRPFVAAE